MWPFDAFLDSNTNRDFVVPTKRGPLTVNAYTEQEAREFAEQWSRWEDEEEAKRENRWPSPFAAWLQSGRAAVLILCLLLASCAATQAEQAQRAAWISEVVVDVLLGVVK